MYQRDIVPFEQTQEDANKVGADCGAVGIRIFGLNLLRAKHIHFSPIYVGVDLVHTSVQRSARQEPGAGIPQCSKISRKIRAGDALQLRERGTDAFGLPKHVGEAQ